MANKIVAITGSYRRGRIIDNAVAQMLKSANQAGAETTLINLLDKHIEFCRNCRKCASDDPKLTRGKCIHNDDMEAILGEIEKADCIILAAPMNFYNVTAIMRRFIERLISYSYWPWGVKAAPALRIKTANKKAVVLTSSASPLFLARIFMPGAIKTLKIAAKCMGARTIKSLHFGLSAINENQPLTAKQLNTAYQIGQILAQA